MMPTNQDPRKEAFLNHFGKRKKKKKNILFLDLHNVHRHTKKKHIYYLQHRKYLPVYNKKSFTWVEI